MGHVIETESDGRLIIPAELLGDVKPKQPFIIESHGAGYNIHPAAAATEVIASPPEKLTPDEWLKQWREMAEEIGKVWPEGVSATQVISDMRR